METSRRLVRTPDAAKSGATVAAFFIFALLAAPTLFADDASARTAATAQAQEGGSATVSQSASRGQSIVRGRVFYEETGQPARRVQVLVIKAEPARQQYEATTDERGEFSVRDLPAGKYTALVHDPEIIDPFLISVGEGRAGQPTVSVDGKGSAEVQIRVRRGGSITGRVTRADGKPADGAKIELLVKRDGRLRQFNLGGRVRADEHGIYRASGLPTGEYMVSADEVRTYSANPEDEEGGGRANKAAQVATLYPSATNIRNATTVHVDAGGETRDINITLIERATYKLSGTIRTRRGAPPRGQSSISLREKDESGNYSVVHQTKDVDAQGRWRFDDVPDGTYVINVIPHGEPPPNFKAGKDREPDEGELLYPFIYKQREVTVAGADLTDVAIEVSEGASISGTVEIEGGQPLPANLNISPEADFFVSSTARVRSDGTFKLHNVPPGNVYLYLSSTTYGESSMTVRFDEYYVKSIYAGGAELEREPLKLEEGGEIKNVRLVLSKAVATVTGHVRSAKDGVPVRGVNVALLPADPARQRIGKGIPYGFTNAAGAYCASAAPGEYLLIAFGESDLPLTDEKVKALAANAPRITLGPKESKSVDLTVPGGK